MSFCLNGIYLDNLLSAYMYVGDSSSGEVMELKLKSTGMLDQNKI